jgi:predicted nucleic acid-binding protein
MILVDTSVLLDILNDDRIWANWSQTALQSAAQAGALAINDIVYTELSTRFTAVEEVDVAIQGLGLQLASMPRPALLAAGKAYQRYRLQGGTRTGVLSDFFVGAHATAEAWPLLTRDTARIKTYFPAAVLIAP